MEQKNNFKVNLGSFGHDSLWRFTKLRNDKYMFKFLNLLPKTFHCQNDIDFKFWKETIKVMESYEKNGEKYSYKSISLKNCVTPSISGDGNVLFEFFRNLTPLNLTFLDKWGFSRLIRQNLWIYRTNFCLNTTPKIEAMHFQDF